MRGKSWAYNDPDSQSGYGITRYTLLKMGETGGYFGQVIQAGYHQSAIRMVASGLVTASAIDSHVLALELQSFPKLAEEIRIIDALGPSTIQPVVAGTHLPASLREEIRQVLVEMHTNPQIRNRLDAGFIQRFVGMVDADYDDIRLMLKACQAAGFIQLR